MGHSQGKISSPSVAEGVKTTKGPLDPQVRDAAALVARMGGKRAGGARRSCAPLFSKKFKALGRRGVLDKNCGSLVAERLTG